MSQFYDLVIRCNSKTLPHILQAVDGSATVISVNVVREKLSRQKFEYVGDKRDKGISGYDLVLQLFKIHSVLTSREIIKEFVKKGFSANSPSPQLSKLKKEGKIKSLGNSRWQMM